jgi:hypothetical protein
MVGREARKPVVVPLRPSGLDLDVLTFHIAQLAQAFAEGREQDGQVAGIARCVRRGGRRQKAYSSDLPRPLGLGHERRGDKAT